MRLRSIGVVVLGLLLTGVGTARAQVATTGSVQVIVEDAQGGRLPGVAVTASAPDSVTTRTAVTDGEGVASLQALAPSARYIIRAQLSGFRDLERTDILVRTGQVTTLPLELSLSTVTEQVTVTGQATPVVDVTRAVAGQDLTLRLTESLPTGRSYQAYLQLVPGVLPDSQQASGNPSSRSGMNWKDAGGASDFLGSSADNFYYFEGINVTDPVTGTFGANLNVEIIQEQKVVTGGIPSEYVGASGLISTVITKSGSNLYSGSGNYFIQNDGLVAKNINNPANQFSRIDTAFTLGGPIVKNSLWAFGSYRYIKNTQDVSTQDTRQFLREVDTVGKQGFFKTTYAPTQRDTISFLFLNDPQTRSGSIDPTVVASRDRSRDQGGNNYSFTYNRVFTNLLLEGAYSDHDTELTDIASDRTARNTVAFQRTTARTLSQEQLGGFGQDFPEYRPTQQARIAATYQWNQHRIKGGYEWAKRQDDRDLIYTPDTGVRAQYTSIASNQGYDAVTAASIANSTLWSTRQFNVNNASDFNGLISTINGLPNRAEFYAKHDTNADGTISAAELGQSLVFNSTAGNPNGQFNYYRIAMTQTGRQTQKLQSNSFYVQDDVRMGQWAFNVGLRAEKYEHFSTTDQSIYAFDWTWAPRLSAVYDIKGDGRQKASAYWGRYFDPIRMDMSNFAGTTSGSTREEQAFINNQWVKYRTRGFSPIPDGLFAPITKTPYTDELQLMYEVDLGKNQSASVTYYNRRTRDVFEDFDPGIYTVPSSYVGVDGKGNVNDPNSLFLGWEYFGFDSANPPAANFYLGTLSGGERDYNGLELVYRKRYADNWQGLFSYSYLNAQGNTVSDGNADFAGDVFWLDPRAPNMNGTIPGTVQNLFKAGGSYTFNFGLELGGSYSWNSGTIVNINQLASNRRLPIQVNTPFTYGGLLENWVDPVALAAVQNPSYNKIDMRARYLYRLDRVTAEITFDVFNLFNNQDPTRVEDLAAGTGATKFGSPIQWLNPRSALLGFRVGF